MTSLDAKTISAQWTRLGAMFNVSPARETPDLEHLLADTARFAPENGRLFVMAATWLARYGDYVAKHRLAHIVRTELEPEYLATMGFLLDVARESDPSNRLRFNAALEACLPVTIPGPLLAVERENPAFWRPAEKRASKLSLKWGQWFEDFDLKFDALRPAQWVAAHNPSLAIRALTGGDLVATVLAECQSNSKPVESESELARRCGASRLAVRDALKKLKMAGIVQKEIIGHSHAISVRNRIPSLA